MEVQEITKEVEIYNKAITTFGSGTAILQNHQLIASKAEHAIIGVIDEIQANGGDLTEALDKKCNDLIALCNTRKKEMESSRKEVTQMFDVIKKMFIAEEAKLDVKKDSKVAIVQQFRNEYATKLAQEAKRKEEEARRKAQKENEITALRTRILTEANYYITQQIEGRLNQLRSIYRSITLENSNSIKDQISNFDCLYSYDLHNAFVPSFTLNVVSREEVKALLKGEMAGLFNEHSEKFKQSVEEAKNRFLELIPGRILELEEIAKADGAKAEQMRQTAASRQDREEEESKRKLEEQKKAEADKIENEKSAAEMDTLFNQTAEAHVDAPRPDSRAGFEISVTNRAGWLQVFQMWFQHEGQSGTDASIERKSLGSMKKFCEKHAHKTGEMIDSKFIEYKEVYTAINRK